MFQTLRSRLILSQILPLLIIIPVMASILTYILESQVLLPNMVRNLAGDARLLAEVSRANYELWGDPYYFELVLRQVQLEPAIEAMFIDPDGRVLYASYTIDVSGNTPGIESGAGTAEEIIGLGSALKGREVVVSHYSILRLNHILIDVLEPVFDPRQQVIGIVRLTYHLNTGDEMFAQSRTLLVGVSVLGLLAAALIGSLLAINIGRPVQQVTRAINDLASGQRHENLVEQGPEEMRAQVRAVNLLVERLHSLEDARRQLLANLVHELGRPLGALRSAIHALSKGAANDPQLLDELRSGMEDEAGRMQHILDDLAHLYDQVLGTLELKREPIALGEWLPSILRSWQEAAQEKRLAWRLDLPPDLPMIYIDPVRMAQVVGNLVSNAIKYTPAGRSMTISAGRQENEAWILVSDTGPGITPEEQLRIFEPFYRGDQGRRIKQGMGLGLSIARDLAIAHGGRIELESTPGLGSKFTVWIPISK
jgi:two-component system sensor histidine kinase BaeS